MEEIKRGEIYWVNWQPARGSEQSGRRPALVIQNNAGNRSGQTTIVAAVSTAEGKAYPFLVPIAMRESGLPKNSVINLAQILTVDKDRLESKCGELGADKMAEVDRAIKVSLSLE